MSGERIAFVVAAVPAVVMLIVALRALRRGKRP